MNYFLTPTQLQVDEQKLNDQRTAAENFLLRVGVPATKLYQAPPMPIVPGPAHGFESSSKHLAQIPTRLDEPTLRFMVNATPRGDMDHCAPIVPIAQRAIGIDTRWYAKTGQLS